MTRTFTIQNLGTASLTLNLATLSGANAADFSVITQPASHSGARAGLPASRFASIRVQWARGARP